MIKCWWCKLPFSKIICGEAEQTTIKMEADLMHLAWNEFQNSSAKTFRNLHTDENFTDVTLACADGSQVKGHKVILSSSSPFFKNILLLNPHQHPLLFLKGIDIGDLRSLMEFIYCGEVEIQNEGLVKFLEAANELQIDGLQQRGNGIEKLIHTSTEKGGDTVLGERPYWQNKSNFKELLLSPKSPQLSFRTKLTPSGS